MCGDREQINTSGLKGVRSFLKRTEIFLFFKI